MSAFGGDDVQEKLYSLEQEERLIMQELIQIDEADHAARQELSKKPAAAAAANPRAAINALVAECEKEVRNAKGYIKSHGPPLQIARCRPGANPAASHHPKHATFLSRPKDTGVDFTVPVTLPEYLAVIKAPIFLNDIRDKCKAGRYTSAEEYVEDMRLLARNTANFNKGEDLAWVVQHARLLLEAAEDAVASRRADFHAAENALRLADAAAAAALAAAANTHPGKRKRTADANGVAPAPAATTGTVSTLAVGTRLSVLWPDDQVWYLARVIKKTSTHRAEVEYDDDGTRQIIDLRVDKWRHIEAPPTAHGVSQAHGRGGRSSKPDSGTGNVKRHKSISGSPASGMLGVPAGPGVSMDVLQGSVSRADVEEIAKSLTLRIEEARVSILEEMSARMDRIEQNLLRSDAMRRVLLTVDDLGLAVAESTDQMRESISSLEDRLVSLISPVENDHVVENGADALDLASKIGPRLKAAGKADDSEDVADGEHGGPAPVGLEDDEVHGNREKEIEDERVTSERALGHVTDPVADAQEKESTMTRNEAGMEAQAIDESVVRSIRSDLDQDRKARNEVVGTASISVRKRTENLQSVAKGDDAMSVDSEPDVEESRLAEEVQAALDESVKSTDDKTVHKDSSSSASDKKLKNNEDTDGKQDVIVSSPAEDATGQNERGHDLFLSDGHHRNSESANVGGPLIADANAVSEAGHGLESCTDGADTTTDKVESCDGPPVEVETSGKFEDEDDVKPKSDVQSPEGAEP